MFSALLLLLLGWLMVTRTAQFIAQQPEIDLDSTWDLELGPNPNDTANLVFNSVHSLSMGWPNRRYRNGVLSPFGFRPRSFIFTQDIPLCQESYLQVLSYITVEGTQRFQRPRNGRLLTLNYRHSTVDCSPQTTQDVGI